MKRTAIGICLALACAAPASASAAKGPTGAFVGRAGKVAIGVVVDRAGVVAYVCDGRRVGVWLSGRKLGRLGSGRSALTVRARGRSLRARFAGRTARLRRATGRAGVYRSERRRRGRRQLAGWVVLPGGRQVGVVATGSNVSVAPTLSVTSLTAGSFVAGHVVTSPAANQLAVIDLGGDDVDLSGRATTALAGGATRTIAWTRPNDDDAFISLDKSALAQAGYRLTLADGSAAPATVLARGGLRITEGGTTTTTTGGFHLLRLLDSNADGRVNTSDRAFPALRAFNDGDGDGSRDIGEAVQELRDAGVGEDGVRLFVQQRRVAGIAQAVEVMTAVSRASNSIALAIIGHIAA